jgi:hypothetical protein
MVYNRLKIIDIFKFCKVSGEKAVNAILAGALKNLRENQKAHEDLAPWAFVE